MIVWQLMMVMIKAMGYGDALPLQIDRLEQPLVKLLQTDQVVSAIGRRAEDNPVAKLLQVARLGGVTAVTAARQLVLTDEIPDPRDIGKLPAFPAAAK